MALILEFRKRPSADRKLLPAVGAGLGSVVLFTGVRYERIASSENIDCANPVLSRKPSGHRRRRPVEVQA